ncbi:MAG: hypothetical protein GY856_10615 [bacterium]|nr:hypothetical protein [bacterium]
MVSGQSITRGPAVGREFQAFRGRLYSKMEINYRDAARRHWDDAELLEGSNRFPNSDQLYGLAAECALKEVMVALGAFTTPEGDLSETRHRQHIDALWPAFLSFASGRRGSRYLSPLRKFDANPFEDWNIVHRYAADSAAPSGSARTSHAKAARSCFVVLQRATE